ncbi:hypothetical protein ACFE04_012405 [Oxalis oulophora]
MEGQTSFGNLEQLVSPNFDINLSYEHVVDDPTLHFLTMSEKKPYHDLPLTPLWIDNMQEPSRNYVQFLAENSTFLEKASPAEMLKCVASPPVGSSYAMDTIPEFQRDLSFTHLGKAYASQPCDEFSQDANAWNVKPSVYVLNNVNHHETSVNNFLHVHSNGESMKQYTSHDYPSYVENLSNHTMWQPRQSKSPDFLPRPKYPSARHRAANTEHISKREKAVNTDRLRRERIAERIKALEGLLPHPVEGNQAAVIDEVVDLIKYLQLQVKELSRSRLGGEPTITPFIFLEGFGHYVHQDQMMNEPLEEMIGNLLENDLAGATQLLENKGLYMMPLSLVEALRQAI